MRDARRPLRLRLSDRLEANEGIPTSVGGLPSIGNVLRYDDEIV